MTTYNNQVKVQMIDKNEYQNIKKETENTNEDYQEINIKKPQQVLKEEEPIQEQMEKSVTRKRSGSIDKIKKKLNDIMHAGYDLTKETVTGGIDLAKETVNGSIGLAKSTVSGGLDIARHTVTGSIDLALNTVNHGIEKARGIIGASEEGNEEYHYGEEEGDKSLKEKLSSTYHNGLDLAKVTVHGGIGFAKETVKEGIDLGLNMFNMGVEKALSKIGSDSEYGSDYDEEKRDFKSKITNTVGCGLNMAKEKVNSGVGKAKEVLGMEKGPVGKEGKRELKKSGGGKGKDVKGAPLKKDEKNVKFNEKAKGEMDKKNMPSNLNKNPNQKVQLQNK